MNRQERIGDKIDALQIALDGKQAEIWTALPCIVESFDADNLTVTAQVAVKGVLQDENGLEKTVPLPLLVDVPVFYPQGGGFTLTFPIKKGDECLVVFSSRCIDGWWAAGGVQDALENRMHDLSDGFAFVGFRSIARKLQNIDTSAVQLRTDSGETFLSILPENAIKLVTPGCFLEQTKSGEMTLSAKSQITLDAPQVNIKGQQVMIQADAALQLVASALSVLFSSFSAAGKGGSATADCSGVELVAKEVTAGGVKLSQHKHTMAIEPKITGTPL